ncbi:MAG TPA: DUF3341 domain-containing protein [Stellaceae bacterium]|jgi:hypothetical protein
MSDAEPRPYGLIGEFAAPEAAVALARRLRSDGFRRFEVYSPLPLEEMNELLASRPRRSLALIMFAAALGSGALAFLMQYVIAVIAYPLNIGGRPFDSWPAFIPSAWEICALGTVYAGFVAFLAFCRLPQPYHPIFNAPRFERASQDRVFLCVEIADPRFDEKRLRALFREHASLSVAEVPL